MAVIVLHSTCRRTNYFSQKHLQVFLPLFALLIFIDHPRVTSTSLHGSLATGVELSLPPDGVPEVGVVTSEKKSALLQRARARDTHQAMRRQLVTSEPQ